MKKHTVVKKKRTVVKKKRTVVLIVIGSIAVLVVVSFLIAYLFFKPEFKQYTDISEYNQYNPIFPENPQENEVKDFNYVYYNPFDAQEVVYLVTEYDDKTLEKELKRLDKIGIEEYKGIYSVTGINEKYNLLAMDSDEYSGFVYAMQDKDNKNRIVYVLLDFCNYFYDLEYETYIPNEYLPVGFEAHADNPYQISKSGNS